MQTETGTKTKRFKLLPAPRLFGSFSALPTDLEPIWNFVLGHQKELLGSKKYFQRKKWVVWVSFNKVFSVLPNAETCV
jgi:hypothetical protein